MSMAWQSRLGSPALHENLQLYSQPSPVTRLPSSHSSPMSLTPFPQWLHTPSIHCMPVTGGLHGVKFEFGTRSGHVCVVSSQPALWLHLSAGWQLRAGSDDRHVKWQFASQ